LREKQIGTSGAQTGAIGTGEEEHGATRLGCEQEKELEPGGALREEPVPHNPRAVEKAKEKRRRLRE
jgi:hypothetical protein